MDLDEELLAFVADIVGEGSSVRLKEQLIKCLSVSEIPKLNYLLSDLQGWCGAVKSQY